ncbi:MULTISPECIES: ATP-dependent helicase [unclassified Bradyrhizobium]|uniref:ATP-dependent helicase n=1 Tax=unclassified Bradyrhizobium TaxID=2631580 RepID=UPI002304C383|nr:MULTISPECIES: ATP-dependent helicase [unclassified Bradyrhizobium]MDA9398720.1 helicase UvrD [Bradyrhizobium sp. CCBAU 45389]MDA9528974.1 helicase UvrD [Bradyrhizobium sp. CCBAU 25338]
MIRADRWAPTDNLKLEPNALAAATEIERSLALTAGPGAGKTEMLAQRADFLLRTGTCRYPKRILAISFKVDASHNLKARVRKRCGSELAARFDSHTFHAFAKRIIDRFRLALTGRDALDPDYSIGPARIRGQSITFGDMVPLALTILGSSEIARNAIRQTYSHVFLDEFQDCTKDQYKLITACFLGTGAKLVAVGDTKQKIMGWAGALEGIFKTYAADFNAKPLNLYQNFRSTPRLRRMQNAMVRVMDPAAALDEKELQGDDGEIEILRFKDAVEEASYLADAIGGWIESKAIEPSEIAVLVSKQQNLYCQSLRAALGARRVPFREEDQTQDIASEPIARLITDFLSVLCGSAKPEVHRRLLETVVYNEALDDEQEHRARSRWDRFIADVRRRNTTNQLKTSDRDTLAGLVDELIGVVGRDGIVILSADYAQGNRLDQLIENTIDRISDLVKDGTELSAALAAFSADRAVRIMSIHKSKGLEFDSVIIMGIENETFWGKVDEERSTYFVGISRAKKRLLLTLCDYRDKPQGATRWSSDRTAHAEFLGYAESYA